jgi:hypothetical protein
MGDRQNQGYSALNQPGEKEKKEEEEEENRRKNRRLLIVIIVLLGLFGLLALLAFSEATAALAIVNNLDPKIEKHIKNVQIINQFNNSSNSSNSSCCQRNFLYAFDNISQEITEDEENAPNVFVRMIFRHVVDTSPMPPGWSHPNPTDFVANTAGNYTVVVSAIPGVQFVTGDLHVGVFWMFVSLTKFGNSYASVIEGSLTSTTLSNNGGGNIFDPHYTISVVTSPLLIPASPGDILRVMWAYQSEQPIFLQVFLPGIDTFGFTFAPPNNISGFPLSSTTCAITITQI